MRPVDRGAAPKVKLTRYQDARPHLIERLGEYCSYCEMHLDSGLHVEHIRPKSKERRLKTRWGNLLLACWNCNPTKGSRRIEPTRYYWPHLDNTFRAIEYVAGGYVRPAQGLTPEQWQRAERTIRLTGLNKTPPEKHGSDRRWQNRADAWSLAEYWRDRLAQRDGPNLRKAIEHLSAATGFFSVWITVFREDRDMLKRFIRAFKGTARDCFDPETCEPVPRPGGAL
jgi:uncharacterized protein (TIGR02646 family)